MNYRTIIKAETLAQHLSDPNWVIIDARFDLMVPDCGYQEYLSGHIENAYYAHLDNELSGNITAASGRHPLPDILQFESVCRLWGVHSDSQVIVYDDSAAVIAARLWWMFRWLGHSNVAVLDGGLQGWKAAGYGLSTTIPQVKNGTFTANADSTMLVSTQDIESNISRPQMTLIDVRDRERFQGFKEPIDSKKGHIPGAKNLPFKSNLSQQGFFLPREQLQALYQAQIAEGLTGDLACMCGSGVTACHSLLALEIAGIEGAKLYAGSWSEWICDPSHAIVDEST